jgi:hypothetical protein
MSVFIGVNFRWGGPLRIRKRTAGVTLDNINDRRKFPRRWENKRSGSDAASLLRLMRRFGGLDFALDFGFGAVESLAADCAVAVKPHVS